MILAIGIAGLVAACGGSSSGGGGSTTAKASAGTGYGGYASSGGSSSSSTGSATSSTSAGTLKLVHTSLGTILVDSRGFTVYLFTADSHNRDRCVTQSGCAAAWPPITVSGHPTAGSGVSHSLLGTTKLPNGHLQVTYAGHPLYGYTGDGSPASTSYVGISSFGGAWYGVSATGQAVH